MENSKIEDFSMPYSDFPVLFNEDYFFKEFSRKPSIFKYFSSLYEPCRFPFHVLYPTLTFDKSKVNKRIITIPVKQPFNVVR